MRSKRLKKFKRNRRKRAANMILFAIILPCVSIFAGYLITSLIILPAMVK